APCSASACIRCATAKKPAQWKAASTSARIVLRQLPANTATRLKAASTSAAANCLWTPRATEVPSARASLLTAAPGPTEGPAFLCFRPQGLIPLHGLAPYERSATFRQGTGLARQHADLPPPPPTADYKAQA